MAGRLGIDGIEDEVEIGRGGFGVVYRARQPAFEREVAVKILTVGITDDRSKARFERECAAIGRLSDIPGVVTVHGAGTTASGALYLVMAYLPGGSLADRLVKTGRIDPHEVVQIGVSLARSLAHAHDAGILHLDIKPANVLVDRFGQPQLGDFGIARLVDAETMASRSGFAVTPAHSAPEILEGLRPTSAADVYSLGSTLYTLAVGHPAFVDPTRQDGVLSILTRSATQDPPDPATRGVEMPPALWALIQRTMSKVPQARPTTTELIDELAALESRTVTPQAALLEPEPEPEPETTLARTVPSATTRAPAGPAATADESTLRANPTKAPSPPPTRATARRPWAIALAALTIIATGTVAVVLTTADRSPDSALKASSASHDAGSANDSIDGTAFADLDASEPVGLERPPFPQRDEHEPSGGGLPVSQTASEPNSITDEDAWFAATGLSYPRVNAADAITRIPSLPSTYRDLPLMAAWGGALPSADQSEAAGSADTGPTFATYGTDVPTVLVALDVEKGAVLYSLDFSQWVTPPTVKPGDEEFVHEGVIFAVERGSVLYVSTGHNTYAESSGGANAYLSALELPTGRLLWRSPALVANARTFVVLGDSIVSGYGFTEEDDFLYVLNANDGTVQQRLKVPTGPDYLIYRDGTLYVRTYDRNMQFSTG